MIWGYPHLWKPPRNSWKPDPFVIVNMFPRLRHSRPKLWSLSPDYFSVVYPVPIASRQTWSRKAISDGQKCCPSPWGWKLVGGLEHVLFSHILGIMIPIVFHIFQRGFSPTTNQERFSIQPRSRGSAAIPFPSIPSSVAGRLGVRGGFSASRLAIQIQELYAQKVWWRHQMTLMQSDIACWKITHLYRCCALFFSFIADFNPINLDWVRRFSMALFPLVLESKASKLEELIFTHASHRQILQRTFDTVWYCLCIFNRKASKSNLMIYAGLALLITTMYFLSGGFSTMRCLWSSSRMAAVDSFFALLLHDGLVRWACHKGKKPLEIQDDSAEWWLYPWHSECLISVRDTWNE